MRKYIKENDFCGHLCQYAEQNINILKLEIDRLKAENVKTKDFAAELKSRFAIKFGDKTESLVSFVVQREIDNLLKEKMEDPT